jgi:hypothetical protein
VAGDGGEDARPRIEPPRLQACAGRGEDRPELFALLRSEPPVAPEARHGEIFGYVLYLPGVDNICPFGPKEIELRAQAHRLIDGAPDAAVRNLIMGAYLTGARYGELAEARVLHFDARAKTLGINVGKTGTRTIILQTSAADFFSKLAGGRGPDEFLLVRSDGRQWKKSDQTRPIKDALKRAGLAPDGSLYALRHTYVSHAIEGGVPLNVIADLRMRITFLLESEKCSQLVFNAGGVDAVLLGGRHKGPRITFSLVFRQHPLSAIPIQLR